MSCVAVTELVQRMAALSLQSNSNCTEAFTILEDNARIGSLHGSEDTEMPDCLDIRDIETADHIGTSSNEVALQGA